jgi:hypothetical protein
MISPILGKLIGIVAVLLLLMAAARYFDHAGYERCRAEMEAQNLKVIAAYNARLNKAEGERDANQNIIDQLNAHARSVRIHIPICPSVAGAEDKNGTAGVLSQRVDESFARLQERTGQLFKRCDELNLDAIKVNAANR